MARSLLVAWVAIFGMALGQETSAPMPTDQAEQKAPPGVLAEMDGYTLTEDEFNLILNMLPALKKETLTPEQKRQIINQWMLVVASAEEAHEQGLDQDPLLAKQLDLYRKQLLFERHQRQLIKDVVVTEEETRKYFEENRPRFTQAAQAKISRIVVPTREKAEEVSQALKAGRSFEELVTQYSVDDASKQSAGDMGWVALGRGEPAFEQAVATLEPNQISAPFETKVGWQIIRLAEKRPGLQREYGEVQEALSKQLLARKQRGVTGQSANELFKKHHVKVYSSQN